MTLGQTLEKSAQIYGDRDVIKSLHQNKKFTFAEALDECDRLAAGFQKIGLVKGDRIGIWCPSLIEWFTVKFACARAGMILVGKMWMMFLLLFLFIFLIMWTNMEV